ncbi:MAG: carboxylesterase family protein, partial [Erysipelotrichaceae bacterium]|nr:carboxylesterase family protein [Erysipelotrichaceae bacterium]
MQKSLENIQITGLCTNHTEIYYGIPYGTAERWCNPLPYVYKKDLDCTEKEEIALQLHHGKIEGTTDCLTLDIYTKENAKDLPVFVFLHGGNNQTGSSYGEITGELLVDKVNCVVVCINHRLGFLGFNALPSIAKETGNFTMLDIQLALQWVQQYIPIFGGNPSNVALTGFSAGGRNVMATLTSKLFTGLYHKAIPFSGGMTLTDLNTAAKKQAEMMSPLVMEDKNLNKEEAIHYLLQASEEVRDYLFNITDERLTQLNVGAGIRMAKFPHLFKDDVVFPTTGFNTFVNDVPILLLTGTTEFSFFGMKDPYFNTLEEPVRCQAINFMNKYGSDFYRIFNGQLSAQKLKESNYQSNIYVTEINYGNTSSAYPIPLLGSFHGIFVPMLNPNSSM